MEFLRYWGRVAQQAWRGTLRSFGFTPWNVVRTVVVFAIAIIGLWKYQGPGGAEQVIEEIRWGVVIVQALVGTFILMFPINLVSAPVQIEAEARQRESRLVSALAEKEKALVGKIDRKKRDAKIANYLGQMATLHVEQITEEQFPDWNQKQTALLSEVTLFLMSFAPIDASDFSHAAVSQAESYVYAVNKDHNACLLFLKVRIDKLTAIARRLQATSS